MSSLLAFELLRPAALVWVLAAVAVFLVGWYGLRARERAMELLVSRRQRARFLPGFSPTRARTRLVLAACGAGSLALALTGPVRGYTVRDIKRRGLDLVVCIDTSRSMLVRDLRPDRMTRAKREVRGLLDRMQSDRVAIIAFAGEPREIAPLTHDRTTLAALLADVSPKENSMGGTDLGSALERALEMFDGRTGAHEAVVVLTDGEDLEGRGLELARRAAEQEIRIFVVGMGAQQGGKIPVLKPDGSEGFVTDEDGAEVISSLDGASLSELADVTGGAYLPAGASPTPLEDLYERRIMRLEGRELDSGQEWLPHDRFQWFCVLAFGCILAESALRERRPRPRRRRPARRAGPSLAACLPLVLTFGPQAPAPEPETQASVPEPAWGESLRAGRERLRALAAEGSFEEAASVGRAMLRMPDLSERERAEVDFDLSWTLEQTGERAAAIAGFERVRALAGPGELRLDAMYDRGTLILRDAEDLRLEIAEVREKLGMPAAAATGPLLQGPQGPQASGPDPLDQAEARYHAALDALIERLRADWRDEDTRANIELTRRRLRELQEIREQREQQEQEQEQQDQKQDPQQGDQGDPSEQPPEKSEPDPKQDPEQEQSPEQEPQEQPEPEPEEPEQPEQADQAEEEPKGEPQPQEERVLSREEVQRLLDRLQEIEQEAKQLEARLRSQRRTPVKRDW